VLHGLVSSYHWRVRLCILWPRLLAGTCLALTYAIFPRMMLRKLFTHLLSRSFLTALRVVQGHIVKTIYCPLKGTRNTWQFTTWELIQFGIWSLWMEKPRRQALRTLVAGAVSLQHTFPLRYNDYNQLKIKFCRSTALVHNVDGRRPKIRCRFLNPSHPRRSTSQII
jgi:hypothetical protein